MPAELSKENAELTGPERAQRLLERLGPEFVKIGQYLALCPDLIEPRFCDQFMRLRDHAPALAFDDVRRIITEDLGGPPEDFFSWINPRAIVARALSQTHAARTRDGDPVVVKVQRPDARQSAQKALGRHRWIERLLRIAGANGSVSVKEVIADLERRLDAELDYELELRNLTALSHFSEEDGPSRFPRPYASLSSNRVLTAEFLSGVPLLEVLRFQRSGDVDAVKNLRIAPEEVAANLLRTVLDQIYAFQRFQVNVHPDNLFVASGDKVRFAEFALVEVPDVLFRQGMARYLAALTSNDTDRVFDSLAELLVAGEHSDLNQLRVDFYEETGRLDGLQHSASESKVLPRTEVAAILGAARRNGFRVPPTMLLFFRTLMSAENLAGELGGAATLAIVGKPVVRRLQFQAILDVFRADNLQSAVLDSLNLVSDGPRDLRKLLSDLVEGRLVLRVHTLESEEDRRESNARAQLISVSIVSVGFAFLIGAVKDRILFGVVPLSWPLWALLVAVWCWIAFRLWDSR